MKINCCTFCRKKNYGTDYVIENGVFKNTVNCAFPTTIKNGIFDEVVFDQGGTINDGTFEMINASSEDFYEYYGEDIEEYINEDYEMKLTINGGTFRYTGDSGFFTPINIRYVDTIINDAMVINEGPNEIYSDCCWFEDDGNHSLTINGGNFVSPTGYAVLAIEPKSVIITNGHFKGYYGGLAVSALKATKIELSGGKYETTGNDNEREFSRIVTGGITLSAKTTDKIITNTVDDFTTLLKKGCTYSEVPKVSNKASESEELVYTQRNIDVLRKIVFNSENESLRSQVGDMLANIQKGEQVNGMSKDLVSLIANAIEEGKEIEAEIIIKEISEQDITDKVFAIKEAASEKKIAKYFDVEILISIDKVVAGKITEFKEDIDITLPLNDDLPKVEEGHTRIFKVIRVHNGKATELGTEINGNNIKIKSNKFSTYAVVYEDVKNTNEKSKDSNSKTQNTETENSSTTNGNPKTGDEGINTWILLFSISSIGVVYSIRKILKIRS